MQRSKNLTQQFLYNDQVKIGFIIDSYLPKILQPLDRSKSNLMKLLESLKRQSGSRIPQAMTFAFNEFQTSSSPKKTKNLIVMIDRKLPMKDIQATLNQLEEEKVKILFVLFGDKFTRSDINQLERAGKVLVPSNSEKMGADKANDMLIALEGLLCHFNKAFPYFHIQIILLT